jgi:hypothetical protein
MRNQEILSVSSTVTLLHQLRPARGLAGDDPNILALAMFVVSEAQATAARATFLGCRRAAPAVPWHLEH